MPSHVLSSSLVRYKFISLGNARSESITTCHETDRVLCISTIMIAISRSTCTFLSSFLLLSLSLLTFTSLLQIRRGRGRVSAHERVKEAGKKNSGSREALRLKESERPR